jgi:hypothetical protein
METGRGGGTLFLRSGSLILLIALLAANRSLL